MEKRTSWQVFGLLIGMILLLIISGDYYLRNNQLIPEILRPELRLGLLIGLTLIAAFVCLIFILFQKQILSPINILVDNLKNRFDGDEQTLEPLHYTTEISPLLYAVEILLKSLTLESKEAQLEKEFLQSVLDQITDGIIMVNDHGEINSINPAAETIFNIDEEQALGRTLAEVVRHHQWINLYRSCRENLKDSSGTLEIPSQNIFLQGIAIPLEDSLPGYTLLIFQDLSKIK